MGLVEGRSSRDRPGVLRHALTERPSPFPSRPGAICDNATCLFAAGSIDTPTRSRLARLGTKLGRAIHGKPPAYAQVGQLLREIDRFMKRPLPTRSEAAVAKMVAVVETQAARELQPA